MNKTCALEGCSNKQSKRGIYCGPEHMHQGRYGKPASDAAKAVPEPNKAHAGYEEKTENTWKISLDKTRIQSEEELVSAFKVDLRIWKVDRLVINKWEVGAKDNNSKLQIEELYQVKAWLIRQPNIDFAIKELESLKQDYLDQYLDSPVRTYPYIPASTSGNLLELSLPDVHFGKLAWFKETGSDSYDTKIAERYYDAAFGALLSRVKGIFFERIVLVLGNDLFHVDNRSNTTTKGTVVDTDSRYFKVFRKVRQLIIKKIEELATIAPVTIKIVPGNHDEHTTWHLGDSLECWFKNRPDVEIDNEPIAKKVFEWGEVMLMWVHGDKGKKTDYPLTMATEYRKMFGRTTFHEIHCGHLHTEGWWEKHGIAVRFLPSLSGIDYWHAVNNFTGNKKAAVAFVYNKTEGLISTGVYTIPEIGE